MLIVLTLCVLVTAWYLCFSAWVMGGIPDSLSATYYGLGKDGFLFQWFVIVVGLMLLPVWLEASSVQTSMFAFLACGGLMFTGVAPMFRLPLEGAVHYGAAIVSGVCSVLWVLLEGMYPFAVWWGFLGLIAYINWGKYMWWLEVAIMGMVFCALA